MHPVTKNLMVVVGAHCVMPDVIKHRTLKLIEELDKELIENGYEAGNDVIALSDDLARVCDQAVTLSIGIPQELPKLEKFGELGELAQEELQDFINEEDDDEYTDDEDDEPETESS